MKNTIRNLLLTSCLFFSIAYDSHSLGVDYDRRNKLYPEVDSSGCMLMTVYGKRWQRLGTTMFFGGISISVAALIVWRRKKQNEDFKKFSILITEG